MKYLDTKYKLFLESQENTDPNQSGVNKYEIVKFKEDYIIERVYGIDRELSISISRGDKVKLFFDLKESQGNSYHIVAIRPMVTLHNESNKIKVEESKKTKFNLSELWEANFILNEPVIINKDDIPFSIEKYL